ncbi:TonB-dependent receptor [Pseudomaricurvus alkylphenolicus]|uniref:TonB-dependent receptor n=1 Tax=Pseudomaricurvus alkylphenolicus TaxID=1306991 RepID=UPI0014240724|nr:TonB-dependent receptor [Pseudomaricurvus alkylphenolicus]NIB42442.1 TonB-dependent receptor [Pseudomaricurvus alkylphenolicus]
MMNTQKSLAVAVMMAVAGNISATMAAEGGAEDFRLEEIVVTARKIEESLQDVPAAVSAIGANVLETGNLSSVADVQNIVPGLRINSDGDQRAFVQIRGVGVTLQTTIQPGVGLFMDGIYVPYTSSINDSFLDTAQVEVVRGPQGTLFGKNTLGGAINVISKLPGDELEASISGSWTEEDEAHKISARVAGPIIADTLYGSLAASTSESDGFYQHKTVGSNWDARESDAIKGALRWIYSDQGEFRLSASYGDYRGPGVAYTPVPGNNVDADDFDGDSILSFQTSAETEIFRMNGTLTHSLSDSTDLTLTLGYDSREQVGNADRDFLPTDIVRGRVSLDEDFTQAEIRFETQFSDTLRVMYAGFYSRQNSDEISENIVPSAGFSTFGTRDVDDETVSVYGNAYWEFSPSWELAVGLRFDRFEQTGVLAESSVVLDRSNAISVDLEEDPVTPMISLSKAWSDELMMYATYSEGVRAGGFNNGDAPAGFETWDGDEAKSYELGFKSTLADGRVTLNAAVYHVEQDGLILNELVPDEETSALIVVNQNLGAVENTGFEAEFNAAITPEWALNAGISYVSVDVVDDPNNGLDSYDGSLPLQPEWSGHLYTHYDLSLGKGTLRSSVGVYYTDETFGFGSVAPDFTTSPQLDDYVLVNLSADYSIGSFSVGVFAENLTDEGYWNAYIAEDVLRSLGVTQAIGVRAKPRNVGIRLRYDY